MTLFFCCRGNEGPVHANVTVRKKGKLRISDSTSSIPEQITSSHSTDVEDIDREDNGDPFLLPEYVSDIYVNLRELEVRL